MPTLRRRMFYNLKQPFRSLKLVGALERQKLLLHFGINLYIIGITPLFKDRIAANNQEASFNIIALNKNAELLAMSKLRYTLYEEQHDYVWFRSGTHWAI